MVDIHLTCDWNRESSLSLTDKIFFCCSLLLAATNTSIPETITARYFIVPPNTDMDNMEMYVCMVSYQLTSYEDICEGLQGSILFE